MGTKGDSFLCSFVAEESVNQAHTVGLCWNRVEKIYTEMLALSQVYGEFASENGAGAEGKDLIM